LTALKQCLSEEIAATVFEARDAIGGQWYYEEPDASTGETMSSIYEGVILNSCRDTTCFSDFPIDPARYPDYFGHRLFLRYIDEYADHFRLKQHIRFNTKVLSCKQLDNGKWRVEYAESGKEAREEIYDAVFACSGHNSRPMMPEFEGIGTFRGQLFHSHTYRRPGAFEGKRVAIIGIGSSAADISCEIGGQAKELHLVTRRGGWIVPRYVLGKPAEAWDSE
jgi:dimethylaniline monooxygenase (N-oxide forming)